jgi:hypothetical protein
MIGGCGIDMFQTQIAIKVVTFFCGFRYNVLILTTLDSVD